MSDNGEKVSSERDRLNQRLIFQFGRSHIADKMLNDPTVTPEDREEFVKPFRKKWLRITIILAAIFLVFMLWPSKPRPIPSPPKIDSAGIITNLELHDRFLSTTTTVSTSTGIYQVYGGVSAAHGDAATLKTETLLIGPRSELCIESKIKKACYGVL
jgi:hypothetical protein